MTDDIVKYLRLGATRFNRNYEAADEIELLRNLVVNPTVIPKNSVLILSQPAGQQPFMVSELKEIADDIKKYAGIEVLLLSGWDVVGFMEKDKKKKKIKRSRSDD